MKKIWIVVDECDMLMAFHSEEEAIEYVEEYIDEDGRANVYIEDVTLVGKLL